MAISDLLILGRSSGALRVYEFVLSAFGGTKPKQTHNPLTGHCHTGPRNTFRKTAFRSEIAKF